MLILLTATFYNKWLHHSFGMAKFSTEDKKNFNLVHHNCILLEQTNKELKHQKLYTKFSINPYNKIHVIAGKPNSYYDSAEGEEDEKFLSIIHQHSKEPYHKYVEPQTSSQEYGWLHQSLIKKNKMDPRLHFPARKTEITKYMEAAWSIDKAFKQ